MKLFIYEKFWDAFLNIDKTTQKRITEFIGKFKNNSKSSAIHLEPISTFKDDSLRTARITKKYRAVLKEVKPNDIYLLVWVDNHDEAMDWAQNKIIDWNENTQSFQIYQTTEIQDLQEEKDKNVVSEQLFMGQYSEKELLKIGVPEVLMSSVLEIDDIDQLEKFETYLPQDVFENLFYLLDGARIETLITEVNEGKIESAEIEQQLLSKNNHRLFIELTDDEMFNEALQGSLKKWKYYLHPSQAEFVNKTFKESVKVSGGAGTGKTVAALHRLKYLVNNRRSAKPILFTTFTKELTANLSKMAAELTTDFNTYVIKNIDAVAFDLAKEYGVLNSKAKIFEFNSRQLSRKIWEEVLETRLSAYDEEFLEREYIDVVLEQGIGSQNEYFRASRIGRGKPIGRSNRLEIWELIEAFKKIKEEKSLYYKAEVLNLVSDFLVKNNITIFSHIIVDELQDFSNIELRFIRTLTDIGENDLFMVGDPLQNIYGKIINFSKQGINIRGRRSRRLRINYRTTEEIKTTAMKVIQGEEFDDFDGGVEDKKGYLSLYRGPEPEYKVYHTKSEELQAVGNEIKEMANEGYNYSEIVIAARTRDAVKTFRDHLFKLNIPFAEKDLLNSNNQGIRITTFHGMKGLEFKQVFLVDVNDRTLPKLPYDFQDLSALEQNQIIKTEKSLFYVACSRAIERLMISGIGKRSDFLE